MLSRGRKFGNDTIDVANKGCWEPYDTLACLRTGLLTTASTITLIFIIFKIIKYHVYRNTRMHHYAIFYASAIQCIVCTTSFMVGNRYPQVELAACFLKLAIFALVCHLHWSLAARSLGRPDIMQHVANPVLCLYLLYCVAVALMGMVDVVGSWIECQRPYWLMLSVADFLSVQLFSIAALYILHRSGGVQRAQFRDLWSIILVYQVSAVLSLTFDIVMKLVGSTDSGCSGVFGHTQLFYSITISIFGLAKFLVPLWTLLCVLQPFEDRSRASEVALATSYNVQDGTSPPVYPAMGNFLQYEQMRLPNPLGHAVPFHGRAHQVGFIDMEFPDTDSSVNSSPTNSPAQLKLSGSSSPVQHKLPSFSSPSNVVPAFGLSTISEESGGVEVTPSPSLRSESVEWRVRSRPS
ncbi:uncharacterized protein LOC113204483 isoform X1 [Frankliniella occidentalis]|uniref:Uncharacterized protein LOC113204483 isoform X1 n=1 Tax=Frankliniella occidentalis TaxID=133901 RepID=A0A9C6X7C9_FRAOC|nr:uncharacterized protein LOC113204483 isoform X1 [Frankliniella occidentalis]